MAWTTPTSLACIAESNIQTVMDELQTALFQRQDALGTARTTGFSASEHVATRMASYFDKILDGLSRLGGNYPGGSIGSTPASTSGEQFLNADMSEFSGTGIYLLEDLAGLAGLSWDAGDDYISGDTTAGAFPDFTVLIHRRETWTHLQLLFDELKVYRRNGVAVTFGETATRYGLAHDDSETAWDNAKADSLSPSSLAYASWYHLFDGHAPSVPTVTYNYYIYAAALAEFDLSEFDEAINGDVLEMTVVISKYQSNRVMIDIEYGILFGAESWTLPAFTSTAGGETYTFDPAAVQSALGSMISRGLLILTAEPANQWANHAGLDTSLNYEIGSNMTWPDQSEPIFFDITPALTYG